MINKITILGVNISQITKNNAIKTVEHWLSSSSVIARTPKADVAISSHYIVTPNPEMLVLAQKDKEFREVLNRADLAIPDGIGLVWASKLLQLTDNSKQIAARVSGTDLMLDLCQLAAQKGYTVGLLGAEEGIAAKTAEALKKQFPGIKIKFALQEIPPSRSSLQDKPSGHLEGVLSCDLLFVAFGAPKQEKWIWSQVSGFRYQVSERDKNKSLLRPKTSNLKARVYMGVGGAFDLISGKIKRAPKLMRDLGLEWFWRLVQEPKRIKRIWTATVVFSWLVVKSFFKSQPHSDVSSD